MSSHPSGEAFEQIGFLVMRSFRMSHWTRPLDSIWKVKKTGTSILIHPNRTAAETDRKASSFSFLLFFLLTIYLHVFHFIKSIFNEQVIALCLRRQEHSTDGEENEKCFNNSYCCRKQKLFPTQIIIYFDLGRVQPYKFISSLFIRQVLEATLQPRIV